MKEQPQQITEHYYAVTSGHDGFTCIDIGTLSERGVLYSDIHVSARIEWTHSSNYEKEEWTPAKVNWPSIGAQDAATTAEFAKVLLWAAKQAARMDRKHKIQPK